MDVFSIIIIMIILVVPVTASTVYTALAKSVPIAGFFLILTGIVIGFFDLNLSVCVLISAVSISITLGYVLKKRFSTYDGLLLTILSFGLSLVLIIIYLNFIVGQDVVKSLRDLIDAVVLQSLAESKDLLSSGLFPAYQLEYSLRYLLEWYISMLVPVYCLVCGLASYCYARNLTARYNIVLPVSFSKLELPQSAVMGLTITILAAILGSQLDIPNIGFISNVLNISVCVVFAISGLSLLSYVLKAKVKFAALRGLVLAVALLFFGLPLALFGILGQMFNVRKRIKS